MLDPHPWRDDLSRIDALGDVESAQRRRIRRWVRTGRWQEPLPGVVCRTTGSLTPRQRLTAALLYAGPSALFSHTTAGHLWDLIPADDDIVHVTIRHGLHLRSFGFVVVHQTNRAIRRWLRRSHPVTSPARTVLDIAAGMTRQSDVDHLLGRARQRGLVTVEELAAELDEAPRRGSAYARRAVAAVAAGSHAASEARFLRLLQGAGLPLPELNARVETPEGPRYIDALWRHLGKGVEIDGQAYHVSADRWQADLWRQNQIQSTGIVLWRIPARRLWTEPDAVVAEVARFLGLAHAA